MSDRDRGGSRWSGDGRTALIVEDNELNRDMLSRRLARRGFNVLTVPDGAAGVAAARAEHPDVILLDMSLPVMDGWTAAAELRADPDPEVSSLLIIALTAHALAGDREKALSAGCDDYDTKPVDFRRLMAKIEGGITAREAERSARLQETAQADTAEVAPSRRAEPATAEPEAADDAPAAVDAEAPAEAEPASEAAEPASEAAGPAAARWVILAEAGARRDGWSQALTDAGHPCAAVDTIEALDDAVAALSPGDPDAAPTIVALDLQSLHDPSATGRALRRSRAAPLPRVVLVSEETDVDLRILRQLGGDEVCALPGEVAQLPHIIAQAAMVAAHRETRDAARRRVEELDERYARIVTGAVAHPWVEGLRERRVVGAAESADAVVLSARVRSNGSPAAPSERGLALWGRFDELAHSHGLWPVPGGGDQVVWVAGLRDERANPSARALRFAREVGRAIASGGDGWSVSLGLAQGLVVAGVVGEWCPRFHIWGPAVEESFELLASAGAYELNVSSQTEGVGAKGASPTTLTTPLGTELSFYRVNV